MAPKVRTSVQNADASITSTESRVYWIIASAAGTGGAFQLNDSTDDSGTALVSALVGANTGPHFMDFSNAPIQFNTGIRADIPGTNVTITVGYTA